MIKRELAKDPKLADQDWSRFLPKFGKRKQAKKTIGTGANAIEAGPSTSPSGPVTPFPAIAAPPAKKEKKVYTPFPPAQTPRKIDLEMQSGEYFLKPHEKKRKKLEERQEKADAVKAERTKQRLEQFVPPNENQPQGEGLSKEERKAAKKRKREEEAASSGAAEAAGKPLTERKKKSKKAVALAEDE